MIPSAPNPANSDYAAIMRLVEAGELVVADAEPVDAAPARPAE